MCPVVFLLIYFKFWLYLHSLRSLPNKAFDLMNVFSEDQTFDRLSSSYLGIGLLLDGGQLDSMTGIGSTTPAKKGSNTLCPKLKSQIFLSSPLSGQNVSSPLIMEWFISFGFLYGWTVISLKFKVVTFFLIHCTTIFHPF